jgi:anti-sigma factor RsiW
MRDEYLPSDEVLLLVIGELDNTRQAAVRKMMAEDADLAATAQRLDAALTAMRAGNVARVGDEFNERLRQRMLEVFGRTQTEKSLPIPRTRLRVEWRWIMRHPVSRVAAAAIFVLAVGGVILWFSMGSTRAAFADFLESIITVTSAK